MTHQGVLASQEKSKHLLVYPQLRFWFIWFLAPTKFNLSYWNESKGYKKN